ncbi:MAG TPA: ABC-2 family transporter protein [Candidatus Tetragenococcus pullicola]|nr:ABC-2 family transporter protein [Candidatus Tetragenococcus pullicola]
MTSTMTKLKLIRRYMRLSFLKTFQSPIDLVMNLAFSALDIFSLFLFWISLFQLGFSLENWDPLDLLLFVAVSLFSEAVNRCFFGFRDLEYTILDGSFDKFLTWPIAPIASVLLEKMGSFSVLLKASLALILIVGSAFFTPLTHVGLALFCSLLGSVAFALLYGTFSLLCFWFGKIYTARELVFSFQEAKNYPLDILPKKIGDFFTRIVPLAFLATIPTKIMLGKIDHPYLYLLGILVLTSLIFGLYCFVQKRALLRYQSTGS